MDESTRDGDPIESQYEGMLRLFTVFPLFWGLLYGVYHRSVLAIVAGAGFAVLWYGWVYVLVYGLSGLSGIFGDPEE